jgi:hypothetical protein
MSRLSESQAVFLNPSANTREMMAMSLTRMLRDGPLVSLSGSPTVSPVTGSFVAVRALALALSVLVDDLAGLDVLLGVVPGASGVGHADGKLDA